MRIGIGVGRSCSGFGSVGLLTLSAWTADAALGLPLATTALPSTFAGEALIVALAFTFPALAAGGYLALRRLWRSFGLRSALLVGTVLIVGGFATAIAELRPDLLTIAGWTRLAERQ
jgi:hypothetical protein